MVAEDHIGVEDEGGGGVVEFRAIKKVVIASLGIDPGYWSSSSDTTLLL
jgi:hypothetical protein